MRREVPPVFLSPGMVVAVVRVREPMQFLFFPASDFVAILNTECTSAAARGSHHNHKPSHTPLPALRLFSRRSSVDAFIFPCFLGIFFFLPVSTASSEPQSLALTHAVAFGTPVRPSADADSFLLLR
ncbi:hypothetical protein M441DRAFT_226314 [Trichoderma asperellum CBS 433.97]|uniref:Uncharacterized protein n=1 Tax=Trichoderma asperellum (strain ATCC 204424 / CBS 433.97 / NBRC 101777) TaxID=1042311 RepID=A0A2T3ZPZ6_TRIA4|nr:hypothetical protein M441DRAFT_226314 [Trichoderma asperellum CBS 433.97]PTB46877.1 hypothetical protein M441DRAFT_226314 [Trichoderma asperellum CBS 433.97]